MTHGLDAPPRAISIALEGADAMDDFGGVFLTGFWREPSISIRAAGERVAGR